MKRLICIAIAAFCFPLASQAQWVIVDNTKREVVYEEVVHPEPKPEKVKKHLKIKYQGEVNVGYAYESIYNDDYYGDSYRMSNIYFNTVHGILISKYFYTGLGVGLHYAYNGEELMIPLFVNFKGILPVKDICSLYLSISPGYQFGTYRVDGFHWKSGLGVNYKRYNFDVGFYYHDMKNSNHYYYDSYNNVGSFGLYIGAGIKF